MDLLLTAATTLGSVIAGGLITWYFSRRYYKQASEDLNATAERLQGESERLKRFSILMLRAIEELGASGTVELNRDPETGEPIGLQFRVGMTASGTSNVSLDPQVISSGNSAPPKSRWFRFVQSVRRLLRSRR